MEMESKKGSQFRISVAGSHYSIAPKEEVNKFLMKRALHGGSGYVCVSNVHTTMMGFFDSSYREITNKSLLSIPDGMPLVWAMRSLGASDQDRVRGPTLMRELMEKGRESGLCHYLYGGSPNALKQLKSSLEKRYPGVKIVGAESPPFQPLEKISEDDWNESAKRINASGAHFLWVGLGAPKQEKWMWQQRHSVKPIMLGVGAAFDLISGTVPEAPDLLQKFGLEWFYRFLMEPRRLWRRYIFNNPAFLLIWSLQILGLKLWGKSYVVDNRGSELI